MRTVRGFDRSTAQARERLLLDYDARTKSRFVARLENGEEIAVKLPRGTVLAGGDRLLADDGSVIEVVASEEGLSVAESNDPLLLARAAYHLGNRHVPLEIGAGRLAYQHDHVLDEMVRRLGLSVVAVRAPFSPEGGAYGHGAHSHSPAHPHGEHAHDHPHSHDAHSHAHGEHAHPHGEQKRRGP